MVPAAVIPHARSPQRAPPGRLRGRVLLVVLVLVCVRVVLGQRPAHRVDEILAVFDELQAAHNDAIHRRADNRFHRSKVHEPVVHIRSRGDTAQDATPSDERESLAK